MTTLSNDISIKVTTRRAAAGDDWYCYGAITDVEADILLKTKKIGRISAFLVNRQRIPEGCFAETLDEHSSDMQWVGTALLENRYGRISLQSLAEYDDPEFDFMYIRTFHIDDDYKQNGDSDFGAMALHKFLYHSVIKGDLDYGCWKVSSAAYVIDPLEAMTREQRDEHNQKLRAQRPYRQKTTEGREREVRRLNTIARADANQFLRNGFFQDPTLAENGAGSNARILVATYGDWTQPLKSHADAVAVQFVKPPPMRTAKDFKMLDAIKKACGSTRFEQRDLNSTELAALKTELSQLVHAGGSLLRSSALHAACANNSVVAVQHILQQEPAALNSHDDSGKTPLMIAAQAAAGRSTITGIAEIRVIDTLLAAGADTTSQDASGMTAFGIFKTSMAGYAEMILAMTGGNVRPDNSGGRNVHTIETKLYPLTGPTAADMTGGKGGNSGFVDYTEEDAEHDREMMGYGDDSDEYGDY